MPTSAGRPRPVQCRTGTAFPSKPLPRTWQQPHTQLSYHAPHTFNTAPNNATMAPPPPPSPNSPTFFSTVLNNSHTESVAHPIPTPASPPPFHGVAPSPSRASRVTSGGSHKPSDGSFDEIKRSLQARGNNYTSSSGSGGREWENAQRRQDAVAILEGGEECVMWVAAARNEVTNPLSLSYAYLFLYIYPSIVGVRGEKNVR